MTARIGRIGSLVAIAVALGLSSGCATLRLDGSGAEVEQTEIRPDAPPEYDVLVAQDHDVRGEVEAAQAAYQRAAEKDPNSAYLQRKVADTLIRQGRPGDALVYAKRALELEPEDQRTRLFLGQLYRLRRETDLAKAVLLNEDGEPFSVEAAQLVYQVYLESDQPEDAIEMARWLIRDDPDSITGYAALARGFERVGRAEDAERALRDALARNPGDLRVLSQLARAARQRGDAAAEEQIYREVLEDHPHHHSTLLALADVQLGQDDLDGALRTLQEVEAKYPDDVRSIVRLGFLYYEAERFEEAAPRFEAFLERNPTDSEVKFFLGIVMRRLGNDQAALDAFAAIPEGDDHYAEARTQLAVQYERQGEFKKALDEIEKAVAANPTRPRELYAATLRAKSGDFAGAVAFLEKLLLESPGDDELLYNLGIVYGEAKRTEEALLYMTRAIEQNPQNASALNYVGYTWAESGENLDQAEEYIVRALDLRPDDGFITDSLGWVYYMRARPLFDTGREAEARRYLERALENLMRAKELTGGDPVVSEHIGDVHLLLDDRRQALESYEEAVELTPREGEQPELLDKLESLRRELE